MKEFSMVTGSQRGGRGQRLRRVSEIGEQASLRRGGVSAGRAVCVEETRGLE